jgi:hypothetical protein
MDDLGNTVRDQHNSIHVQNFTRIFARALANEPNSSIYSIALGDGGTYDTINKTIVKKSVNNGKYPDEATWMSRLYNQTHTIKYTDAEVASAETNLSSTVIATAKLLPNTPLEHYKYYAGISKTPTDYLFKIDELGLFTSGTDIIPTPGTQHCIFSKIKLSDRMNLPQNSYTFTIRINNNNNVTVTIPVGSVNDDYNYMITSINKQLLQYGCSVVLKQYINESHLIFTTTAGGKSAVVNVHRSDSNVDIFKALNTTFRSFDYSVNGTNAGVDNDVVYSREGNRLLTHLIMAPIYKPLDRTYTFKYIINLNILGE